MDGRLNQNGCSDTSSEDEYSLAATSDDELEFDTTSTGETVKTCSQEYDDTNDKNQNILIKLINRERTGFLSSHRTARGGQQAFSRIPKRLSFCLKDIVPYCYIQGHMFMGLTACGQFLLSYSVGYDETTLPNSYSFNACYKYTLYFWIYRPYQPLGKYYKVCLFDDHGVDNVKQVTITQWITHPRILIVHGNADYENEDSYISIISVPRLGCLDCKELRSLDTDLRCDALCIKCNLTIHTKYSKTESDPSFDPNINLTCPERIVIIANGFIHMLHIELEIQQQQLVTIQSSIQQNSHNQSKPVVQFTEIAHIQKLDKTGADLNSEDIKQISIMKTDYICDSSKNNVVARILADFSEFENEIQPMNDKHYRLTELKTKNYNELVYTCGTKNSLNRNLSSTVSKAQNTNNNNSNSNISNSDSQTDINLNSHQNGRRNQRIVTKSYRNGIPSVNLQSSSTGNCSNDKASAYEFSEDNEKCEKIGTFRKRRLADKKYEFSEDNLENIIPFTKTRTSIKSRMSRVHRSLPSNHYSSYGGTVYLSATPQSYETTNHLHRASPSQGFRSPCGSPVGSSRCMRSPSSRTNNLFYQKSPPPNSLPSPPQQVNSKALNTLASRQASATKRTFFEIGNTTPRNDDPVSSKGNDIASVSGVDSDDKPCCTKKFKRRFVEEDDAASVITSEEDDCISPGYHTSLPVEVHGSCYSDMQMISQTSYQKLKCPTVIITQHSFDLETFTYHVINNLCQTYNKSYDVFYDWACELINVCPVSNSISCILMAHFTARDLLPSSANECINCNRNIDCVFHRKQFECRILFEWNMETGDWNVLDHGELLEIPSINKSSCGLTKLAKVLAVELVSKLNTIHNYDHNLRVLTSDVNKSKSNLTDSQNSVQFYRKRTKWMNSLATAE